MTVNKHLRGHIASKASPSRLKQAITTRLLWPNLHRTHSQSRLVPENAVTSQGKKTIFRFSQVYEKIQTEPEIVSYLPLVLATSELSTFLAVCGKIRHN